MDNGPNRPANSGPRDRKSGDVKSFTLRRPDLKTTRALASQAGVELGDGALLDFADGIRTTYQAIPDGAAADNATSQREILDRLDDLYERYPEIDQVRLSRLGLSLINHMLNTRTNTIVEKSGSRNR